LFQLITQVAGRAGRGDLPGEVVVQSVGVESPALRAAMQHDYARFASAELPVRREFRYPPFTRLTRFVLSAAAESQTRQEAGKLASRIREAIEQAGFPRADVLGPQPCARVRLRGLYRYDLLLRTADASTMQNLLNHLRGLNVLKPKVKSFVIDVDPISLA
jgi:primosomal protein N' (replication factor Y)